MKKLIALVALLRRRHVRRHGYGTRADYAWRDRHVDAEQGAGAGGAAGGGTGRAGYHDDDYRHRVGEGRRQGRHRDRDREGRAEEGRSEAVRADAEQGRRRVDAHLHRARDHDERAGAGALLRRHGAREEHAVGADAGVRHVLAGRRAVVHLRLQPRVHRGEQLLRRVRPPVPKRRARRRQGRVRHGRDVQQGRRHPRDRVRRVPGDVRGDHLLPDRRRVRRARSSSRRC